MAFFTQTQAATLAGTTVRVGLLIQANFRSAITRVWNGVTTLDVNGAEWKPMGDYISVDGLGFSGEPVSRQVTITLNGQDTALMAKAIADSDEADQQPLTVFMQLFDEDWQPVGLPIPVFYGLMQAPRVDRTSATQTDGPVQTISLAVENVFYNRSRPANGRYTDRDQQRRSPGDLIANFVASLTFKSLRWPDF